MNSSIALLIVLIGAAFANPAPTTTTATTTTTVSSYPDCLDDSAEEKICNLPKPAVVCAQAGPADDECNKIASAVNGINPTCVKTNVCKFQVPPSTGTTTAATTTTTTGTTTTTTASTTTVSTTTAGTGSTTTSAPIVAEPNTAYVSCASNVLGLVTVKSCPANGLVIVVPGSASGSTTTTTTAAIPLLQ